jgi:hypothetical protein
MAGPSAASSIGVSVMPHSFRNFGRQVPPPSRISRSLTYWSVDLAKGPWPLSLKIRGLRRHATIAVQWIPAL